MKSSKGVGKLNRREALGYLGVVAGLVSTGRSLAVAGQRDPLMAWAEVPETRNQIRDNLLRFFGAERSSYLPPPDRFIGAARMASTDTDEKLSSQFLRAFGVPLPERDLGNGYRVLTAYQPHEADTKAFVVTSHNSSEVVIAALLHRNCGVPSKDPLKSSCALIPILTVFYPGRLAPQPALTSSVVEAVKQTITEFNLLAPASSIFRVSRFRVEVRRLGTKG
jgi:hypothetical protein